LAGESLTASLITFLYAFVTADASPLLLLLLMNTFSQSTRSRFSTEKRYTSSHSNGTISAVTAAITATTAAATSMLRHCHNHLLSLLILR
jgi:hypothetical protein